MDIDEIIYKFYSSDHIKEIICEIDSNAYDDNKSEFVNALSFSNEIQTQGRIEELAQAINKWEKFPCIIISR